MLEDVVSIEQRGEDPREIVAIPYQRYLLPSLIRRHFLERRTPYEIMVEFDEWTEAEIVRRHVVIGDVFRVEAATQRGFCLIAVRAQPLPIGLQFLSGIDRRNDRGN